MSVIITESQVKMEQLQKEVEALKKFEKIKEEATYTHLTSIIKTILILWFLTIAVFVGGIVWYLSQYDYEIAEDDATINSEGGNANMITGNGSVINNG